jgi:hypothetical protein
MSKKASDKRLNARKGGNKLLDDFSLKLDEINKSNADKKNKQEALRKVYYDETLRYLNNAEGYLKDAGLKGNCYTDKKYVKIACATAYSGLLIALECYLILKDVKIMDDTKRDIGFYRDNIAKNNKKLLEYLNNAYNILHLWGYYDGILEEDIVQKGFKHVRIFINQIKFVSYN